MSSSHGSARKSISKKKSSKSWKKVKASVSGNRVAPAKDKERPKVRPKVEEKKSLKEEDKNEDDETVLKDMEVEVEMEQLLTEKDEGVTQEGFSSWEYRQERILFLQRIRRALFPIRVYLMIFARYPFKVITNEDGTYTYEPCLKNFHGIYFLFMSVVYFVLLLTGTLKVLDLLLALGMFERSPSCPDERVFEMALMDRNLMPMIAMMVALLHLNISSVNIFYKRVYMGRYLSFWEVAVQTMHVDVGTGVLRYIIIGMVMIAVVTASLFALATSFASATPIGAPTLFAVILFGHTQTCILNRTNSDIEGPTPKYVMDYFPTIVRVFRYICGFLFIYTFLASKAFILHFLMLCKMLDRAFDSWNLRFVSAILRTVDFVQKTEDRTTYKLLFKDHCILLDLVEGTDRFIANSVESYIVLHLASAVYEFYFIIRTAEYESRGESGGSVVRRSSGTTARSIISSTVETVTMGTTTLTPPSPPFVRPGDYPTGIVVLTTNIFILFIVLRAAANVGEKAIKGLDIIRYKTMMGRTHNHELYFTLSMFASYTSYKRLALRGAGYFILDKDYSVTFLATFATYFIVVYQFNPILDYDSSLVDYPSWYNYIDVEEDAKRQNRIIAAFLVDLEKTDAFFKTRKS